VDRRPEPVDDCGAITGPAEMPPQSSGFTILRHEVLDSEAARLLSAAARVLLIDFLRKWSLATASGRAPVGIPFTWTGCSWLICRAAWSRAREELMQHGFLCAVRLKAGLFAWSESWQTYQPTLIEVARLEKQSTAQQDRATRTKQSRATNLSPTPGYQKEALPPRQTTGVRYQNEALPPESLPIQIRALPQGIKKKPPPGYQKEALLNTELQIQPPPPPPPCGGGVFTYSGGTVRFGSSTEVWCFRQQHGGDLTGEEWDRLVHVYVEFQTAEAKPAADSLDVALKSKNSDAVAIIARHLDDSSKRALDHISTIVSRYGLPAVVSAVKSLLSDGTPREKRLAFLDHRAKTANVPERDIEIARRVQRESAQ